MEFAKVYGDYRRMGKMPLLFKILFIKKYRKNLNEMSIILRDELGRRDAQGQGGAKK